MGYEGLIDTLKTKLYFRKLLEKKKHNLKNLTNSLKEIYNEFRKTSNIPYDEKEVAVYIKTMMLCALDFCWTLKQDPLTEGI